MSQIQDYMVEANRWWKGNYEIDFKFRQIFDKLQKFMPLRQIIGLVGLRRVGKTTLMHKIIETQIKAGFDPQHILYMSFDEFSIGSLRSTMHEYEDLHEIDIQNGNYLFILDEVQKLTNWENQIKTYYDLYPNIKIIISGSESLL